MGNDQGYRTCTSLQLTQGTKYLMQWLRKPVNQSGECGYWLLLMRDAVYYSSNRSPPAPTCQCGHPSLQWWQVSWCPSSHLAQTRVVMPALHQGTAGHCHAQTWRSPWHPPGCHWLAGPDTHRGDKCLKQVSKCLLTYSIPIIQGNLMKLMTLQQDHAAMMQQWLHRMLLLQYM